MIIEFSFEVQQTDTTGCHDAEAPDPTHRAEDDGLTVGSGGTDYDLTSGRWEQEATPTGENLKAVVRGSPDVAVGAGGRVIER